MDLLEARFTHSPIAGRAVKCQHYTVRVCLAGLAAVEATVYVLRPQLVLVLLNAALAKCIATCFVETLFYAGLTLTHVVAEYTCGETIRTVVVVHVVVGGIRTGLRASLAKVGVT